MNQNTIVPTQLSIIFNLIWISFLKLTQIWIWTYSIGIRTDIIRVCLSEVEKIFSFLRTCILVSKTFCQTAWFSTKSALYNYTNDYNVRQTKANPASHDPSCFRSIRQIGVTLCKHINIGNECQKSMNYMWHLQILLWDKIFSAN